MNDEDEVDMPFFLTEVITLSGEDKKNMIPPNVSKVGTFLFSDGIGPCIAVIACLQNGDFAFFHAFSIGASPAFNSFINKIKDKTSELYIIEKTADHGGAAKHKKTVPCLAKLLHEKTGIDVQRVQVSNYRSVLCCSDSIIISTKDFDYDDIRKESYVADLRPYDPMVIRSHSSDEKQVNIVKTLISKFEELFQQGREVVPEARCSALGQQTDKTICESRAGQKKLCPTIR